MSHELPPQGPGPEQPGPAGPYGAPGPTTPGPYGAPPPYRAPGHGAPGPHGASVPYATGSTNTSGQFGSPQYGAPGRPGFPPPPVRTSTTGPKVMTFVGIGLLIIAAAVLIAGIVQIVSTVSRFSDEPSRSSHSLDYVRLPGSLSFTGEAGEEYAIVVNSTSGRTIDLDDVEVTGPDGRPVDLSISSVNFENSTPGSETHLRAITFTAPLDGTYSTTVTGSSADLPGTLTAVDADEIASVIGRAALAVVAIVAAALLGVLGVGLTIGGGIWWHSRSTARKRAWTGGPGAPPPAYGQYPS